MGNAVSYMFQTNKLTLSQFSRSFVAEQYVALEKNKARLQLEILNQSPVVTRFAPGFHTYFKVDPSKKEDIILSENM